MKKVVILIAAALHYLCMRCNRYDTWHEATEKMVASFSNNFGSMKKTTILIAAAFLILGCTGNNPQQEEKAVREFMESYSKAHTDEGGVSATYDEERNCIDMSMKGDMINISYQVHFKDLLTENPTSYAESFLISMVVIQKDVTDITGLEFVYEGIKFEALPFHYETLDKKGIATAGFSAEDESTRKCLDMLSKISYIKDAFYRTNKGTFRIPSEDITNLQAMARSYILDGGKFE